MKKVRQKYTLRSGFTMLEFVFIIVVIGILAAVIIPRTETNPLQEAANQLVSHIRYTQHLAMIDDKYGENDPGTTDWYKKRWQIIFQTSSAYTEGKYAYTIFSDNLSASGTTAPDGLPNLSNDEIAMDPANSGKYLSGGNQSLYTSDSRANKKMNLGVSYGVTNITFGGGCSNHNIAFDHLGRPLNGGLDSFTKAYENNKLIQSRCEITLISSDDNITIAIEPETGYVHII